MPAGGGIHRISSRALLARGSGILPKASRKICMTGGSKMMTPPSRIHHVNKRNPLNDAVMSKSDSPVGGTVTDFTLATDA
jgi:hypothetical protein